MLEKMVVVVVRSTIAYVVLLVLSRVIGRKMLSHITFFDFVIGIALGSLAVRISLGNESSLLYGILSASTMTALVLLTDLLNLRSLLFRKWEEGEPILLVRQGKLLDSNLAKAKVSVSKVLMLLRQKDVFRLEDVDYALIENDGQLSVWLKPEQMPATAADMQVTKPAHQLPLDLIIDGKILHRNLQASGHDEVWLQRRLQSFGLNRPEQAFYASINQSDQFVVSAYQHPSKP